MECAAERFGEITRQLADRFGGTVVKSTGDGHLATFEGPTTRSVVPKRCVPMRKRWESRSAPASTPESAN